MFAWSSPADVSIVRGPLESVSEYTIDTTVTLAAAQSFEDDPDPALRRHLLRLWLNEDGRPAAPGVVLHKGKGILPRDGKGTYYRPGATA